MHVVRIDRQALWIVAAAALLRGGMLLTDSPDLSVDRDAYLAIARNIADGNGYVHPSTNEPTAYRPPLYPLVLSVITYFGGAVGTIAVLHLALGTATVLLTWSIGRQLGLARASYFAAALVAVDPLLLKYTTLAMSETAGTFLATLLLACSVNAMQRLAWSNALVCGFVLGLSVLCRPVLWVFAALMGVWWLGNAVRSRARSEERGLTGTRTRFFGVAAVAVAVTVSPWLVRNRIVLGRAILTTTHGGYTLVLGNNPVFYREVVAKPWGTVWEDASSESNQAAWYRSLQEQMTNDLGENVSEVDRDQWMYRRAWRSIRNQPGLFIQACCLRFLRLWNVAPLDPVAASLPRAVRWGISAFYVLVFIGLVLGLYRFMSDRKVVWTPIVLLILAITCVHLFYWTNMRMRAPLVPAIALLAAYGWSGVLWPKKVQIETADDDGRLAKL